MSKKTVLVSGCGEGGLGAALARSYAKRGHHVFAAVRTPSKAMAIGSDDIEFVTLDVTSQDSVDRCVAEISQKTNGKLDCLVNNAGQVFNLPMLDSPIEQSKQLFEVNVWGMLRMTQAFAPMLVRSHGTIVNIGSIAGMTWIAYQGESSLRPNDYTG
ncbi:MAG: hypothetical protein Q9162_001596 [Coniocarpon cinnabarinum]